MEASPGAPAGPVLRLLARVTDMVLLCPFLYLLVRIFWPVYDVNGDFFPVHPLLLVWFVSGPVYFFSDSLIMGIAGNNLGGRILGIGVSVYSRRPRLLTFLYRNFFLWTVGLSCMVPVVSLFGLICHFFRYRRTGSTLWDDKADTVVVMQIDDGKPLIFLYIATAVVVRILLSTSLHSLVTPDPDPVRPSLADAQVILRGRLDEVNQGLPRRVDDFVIQKAQLDDHDIVFTVLVQPRPGHSPLPLTDQVAARIRDDTIDAMKKYYCANQNILPRLGYRVSAIFREEDNFPFLSVELDGTDCGL